ncbi:hypothetical protein L210DRAFT_3562540 [Boletus edulis BED1]|uniref:DUF6533 domain-containing protein n=1 Tax=Boletus edulis BED1 TaxID=1328754 RepID=A0AAD4G8B1_BOLED|nr:hypothetical protein L210DRAFT_3562540 [Boletus edulis BED1]
MSDVSELQLNNYVSLAITTAIVYDYILTFTDEVSHIFIALDKPWTRVSTLYILIRYCGLGGGVYLISGGSSFIPGPAKVILYTCCYILVIFGQWATLIFIGAADLTMILRVWAIYSQSKIVLSILLPLYILDIVPLVFESIIASAKFTGTTSHVLDFSFCVTDFLASNAVAQVLCIVQIPLAATMCILVTARFIRQSLSMYAAQKEWHVGHYMSLFAREGMLYFLAIFLFAFCNILFYVAKISFSSWQGSLLTILAWVPMIALSPRCILSVRALYERNTRGRCGSSWRDVDTGFGFTTLHERSVGEMVFAPRDVGRSQEDGLEQHEGIQMEMLSGALDAGSGV